MNKPTVISTFSGCGGSSLGYKMAGFKELLAIDFDKNSVDTFKLNFPDVSVWLKDIKEVSGQMIFDETGLKENELDILDGSPPCQGYSTAGKRNVNDSRNDLFLEFVKLIKVLKPKVFVMENVPSLVKGKMKGLFKEIMIILKELDYNVKCKLLNAKYYRVPQSRARLFWIGVRKDLNKQPVFPIPNHKTIKAKNVMQDLNTENDELAPKGINKELWKKLEPGQNGSTLYENKYFNHCKINWNKPSPTILKTISKSFACLMHPEKKRLLSIAELKRLSTFPDDFQFVGKYEQQWARIGNAVMPKQMEAIAKRIKNEIL